MALRQGILGSVFLNVPYDDKFEALFIAYIAGLTRLGFGIYVTFAEPGPHRLSTIIGLIEKALFEDVVLAATTQHERAMAVAARRRRKPPMAPA